MNPKCRFILISLVLFEFIFLNIAFFIFFAFTIPGFTIHNDVIVSNLIELIFVYNLSWLLVILYIRDKGFYTDPNYRFLKNSIQNLFFFAGFSSIQVLLFKIDVFVHTGTFLIPIFVFMVINLFVHRFLLGFLRDSSFAHLTSNTLLISSGKEYPKLIEFTKNITKHGYKILGYLGKKESPAKRNGFKLKNIGNIKELPNILENNKVDEIFITISSLNEKKIKSSIKIADNYGVRVRLVPENPIYVSKNCKAKTLGDLAVFQLHQSPLDKFSNMILKRLFDFCFSLIVILILSPIYLIIALLIYLDNGRPVFYTPIRRGEAGDTFKCFKFRTMSACDDPMNGTKSTVRNDPRITPIGKILRKCDLDELPQFFNVLKGEMSVVGPRPHRTVLQNDFRRIVNNYMVRSYVKPGITGWAQVNGWRGPTETNKQKKQRVKHDLWYIEHWNMLLDIKIIFLTIFGRHRKNAF